MIAAPAPDLTGAVRPGMKPAGRLTRHQSRAQTPGSAIVQIDTTSEFGGRVARRLNDEMIGWLTTTAADGTSQPSPIWFLWDGETALIYSQPNTPKLRHIEANPKASLHLNSDAHGGDVVILTGQARIETSVPPVNQNAAYVAKYARGITGIGMTPDSFAQAYSVPIRFTPSKLRGH
jgi:PPOX class probable F420-dependent enzyme